jgi:drug/metabolite transporter (DMT)-like permease
MPALSDNARGAGLMMAAMAGFVCNDACMKALLRDLPFFQTVFLRGLLTLSLMIPLAWAMGGLRLRFGGRDGRLVAVRTLAEIGAAYFFITAISNMPLANATAILQALPLTVALGAALFLGEPMGWRRFTAIAVGFAGVMLIVRPGADGFNIYAFWALAAVACVTLRDLSTRRLSAAIPSIGVAVWAAGGVTAFAGIGSLGEVWAPVGPREVALLLTAAALINAAFLFGIMTMRIGEITFVAPFRYTSLLFALVLGAVLFDEMPDSAMLIGSAIVVGTGIYTFYREGRRARVSALDRVRGGT